jgi:hypothetical protein
MSRWWSIPFRFDRVLDLGEEGVEQRAGVSRGAEAFARRGALRRKLHPVRIVEGFLGELAGSELLGSGG